VLAVVLVSVVVGGAAAATSDSFRDPLGDQQRSPDIVSVGVANRLKDSVAVRVQLRERRLAPGSWLELHFDAVANGGVGRGADEVVLIYRAGGEVELLRRVGGRLTAVGAAKVSARFASGQLTARLPRALLHGRDSFALAVAARRTGESDFTPRPVASDFAPNQGRLRVPPARDVKLADPRGDGDVAPDIETVTVASGSDGWLRFTVRFRGSVKPNGWIGIKFDLDQDETTGGSGFERFFLLYGTPEIYLAQHFGGRWIQAPQPWQASARISNGVMHAGIHRSVLSAPGEPPIDAFRFNVEALSASDRGESEFEPYHSFEAYDYAPNNGLRSFQFP
jgi:hypothetical protein